MAICTKCGTILREADVSAHACTEADIMVSEKARETAQAALILEDKIEIVDGKPRKKNA